MTPYYVQHKGFKVNLQTFIELFWREGLEFEQVKLFNLVECPETQISTPWDFKVDFKFVKNNSLTDWIE